VSKRGSGRQGLCAFCGHAGELTKEDVIPRWLAKFINVHCPHMRWEAVEIAFGTDQPYRSRVWPAATASVYKRRIVCGECNNVWMSQLETRVKSVLCPLILGHHVELDETARRVLATWATKTALAHEFIQPSDDGITASDADRCWFRQHQQPLANSGVWLARYTGERGVVIVARSTLFLYDADATQPALEAHGLVTTLVFGQVVLRVGVVRSQPTYATRFAVTQGPGIRMLWPESNAVTWPLDTTIGDDDLEAFISMSLPVAGLGAPSQNGRPPTLSAS